MMIGDVRELYVSIEHLGNGQMKEQSSVIHMRRMLNGKVQLFIKHYIITINESDLLSMLEEIKEDTL